MLCMNPQQHSARSAYDESDLLLLVFVVVGWGRVLENLETCSLAGTHECIVCLTSSSFSRSLLVGLGMEVCG